MLLQMAVFLSFCDWAIFHYYISQYSVYIPHLLKPIIYWWWGLDCFHVLAVINSTAMNFGVEKAMAPHSSTLAWKIPWMEEPGRLQSMGSLRVWHDWATSLSLFTFMHWRRKWQPTPVFLPGESQGRGEPGGLLSMGLHRVGHDWSDLAAAELWGACIFLNSFSFLGYISRSGIAGS